MRLFMEYGTTHCEQECFSLAWRKILDDISWNEYSYSPLTHVLKKKKRPGQMENHFSGCYVFWPPKAGNKGPQEFLNQSITVLTLIP